MENLHDGIRIKLHKIIDKIQNGKIEEDDIELVLIRLREHSPKDSIFREIAHFIAHPNRDSGKTFDSLYNVYCRMCAYMKYQHNKAQLDISKPLEKWEYDFIINQIAICDSTKLKSEINLDKIHANSLIKRCIIKKNGKYEVQVSEIKKIMPIFRQAFGFIKIQELFNGSEIMDSFIQVLESNEFKIDRINIYKYSDLILLTILILMHNRTFKNENAIIGKTILTIPNDVYGNLENTIELRGEIALPQGLNIIVTLIKIDINIESILSGDLIINKEIADGYFTKVFDQNANLTLVRTNNQYILSRLTPQ
ncbi:hypothetical protein VB796_05290 [Arcicella sp. LKC2W]|uniref:hypothetical protein n=1 Tax=Arcicella sp. LKC2W TaxID=2984198 RepID=UPI002B2195EB|nr:hypothetical protein [Arcicella sp. LKC2W]MEA5458440.1 hypothetical protein [Arcicella sp. LKC2W]